MILLPVLFPVICGFLILLLKFKDHKKREIYVSIVVLITSFLSLALIFRGPQEELFTVMQFSRRLSLAFRIDGMARVFGTLVSVLWPLATCYAFEYMEHVGGENKFFAFYTATFGVTLGIAFAANILTLYLFYELLTLVTFPLVIHRMDESAIKAGKIYLVYAMTGAALIFIGLVFVINYGSTIEFIRGGVFRPWVIEEHSRILRQVYVLTFFGFGVKAAVFPFQQWLPAASVAPTTVTALLHAVAVVKAGVFSIMRLTYFCFGADFLQETKYQWLVMAAALITILYGSFRAFINPHFKRRFAYSTISQLSYIIFAVTLMSDQGLEAGLVYMVSHAFIKIVLFYCAGTVIHQTERQYVTELAGLGKKMPWTFGCFTIAGLGLMGIPPTVGFVGKYELLSAVVASGDRLAWAGIGVLGVSVLLTAGYVFSIIKTAFFEDFEPDGHECEIKDPGSFMLVPMVILTCMVVLLGFFGQPVIEFIIRTPMGGV